MGRVEKAAKYATFSDISQDVKKNRIEVDRDLIVHVTEMLSSMSKGQFPEDFEYNSQKERVRWGNITIYIAKDKELFVQMLAESATEETSTSVKSSRLNTSLRDVMIKDFILRSGVLDKSKVYSEIMNGLILGKIKNSDIIVRRNSIVEIRNVKISNNTVIFERVVKPKAAAKTRQRRKKCMDIVQESFKKYVLSLEKLSK